MGNDSQGAVLSGEVQAVKQGAGIFIDTDGTISVDASSVVGLVKLNSGSAFNGYVWPNTKGAQGQMLTMGSGNNLEWTNGGVFVSPSAPLNPEIGDLWFDCTTGQLLVYEACTSGAPKWTSGSEGLPVLPADTSAVPAFISGDGTVGNPYICSASSSSIGGAVVVNRVTITDLAPFQFVPIIDLNAVVNGGRFTTTNNVANASGILVFDILFNDNPISPIGTVYTAAFKIGYGSVYINAPVTLTDAFVLANPGSISGDDQVGDTLTYTVGTAAGGAPPYTYTWVWRLLADGSTLQTGGTTYVTTLSELGESVYVTVTAEDNEGQIVTGSTQEFGPISKPPFPNPTPPTVPTSVGVTSCFTWDGANTTLQSDNCLLFNVGGGSFTQGPTAVVGAQTVCTKWSDSAPGVCANANSGVLIEGCLFDANYSSCGSILIDRIPNAFTILPSTPVTPGAVATSFPITVVGNNAPAFITVGASSDGQPNSYQASINGGSFVNVPSAGNYSLSILPGQTLAVRFTTGTGALTTYKFNVQIGDSTNSVNADFSATTTNSNFPTTPITFPTATSGTGSVGTSVAWGNGTVNLQGTGCIEFSLDGVSYTQSSTQIVDGDILRTRYKAGASCADNTNGQTITGAVGDGTYEESTSLQIDRVPSAVTFNPISGADVSTQYTSNMTTPADYNSTAYVTLAAGATLTGLVASVGGGSFDPIPASGSTSMPIEPGQQLQIKGTTAGTYSTTYSATIQLGVSGTVTTSLWEVQVAAAVPAVSTPSISTPTNGAPNQGTAAGITITSSAYSASGGAGTHASSSWQVFQAEEVNPVTSAIDTVGVTPVYTQLFTRSIRFNAAQQNYFYRTASNGTSRKKWTFSGWFKKSALGTAQGIFVGGNVVQDQINFQLSNASNKLVFTDVVANTTVANLVSTDTFTDTSQWIHIVLSVNTTTSVSANRVLIYVNGTQLLNFDTAIYYSQNADTTLNSATPFVFGANGITSLSNYLSSYATGLYFIDGQNLDPSSFGELSGTRWIPKAYTGTYGINGWELLFATNTSEPASANSVGKDTSGNGNNFVVNGVYNSLSGSNANSVVFGAASPADGPIPSTWTYLVVGRGGPGGPGSDDERGGGGGGGGVQYSAAATVTAGAANTITQYGNFTTNGSSIAFGQTANPGGSGGGPAGPGGTSGNGAPGSPGSPRDPSGGRNIGNGGTGGGGFTYPPNNLPYGVGGGDGRPGQSGTGLPGQTPGGVVVSVDQTKSPISIGNLVYTTATANGQKTWTFTGFSFTGNLVLRQGWLWDVPTLNTAVDSGAGGQVSGNYAIVLGSAASNGGLDLNLGGGTFIGSVPVSKGKWYWEVQVNTGLTISGLFGVAKASSGSNPGSVANSFAYNASTGQTVATSGTAPYGNALSTDQVLGVAFDADNGKVYFAINNVYQNSSNPVTQVNPAFQGLNVFPYYPAFGGNSGGQLSVNFGQRPFVYGAPSGYRCLIEDPYLTSLTFVNNTGLSGMQIGDVVTEDGGDASGVIASVDPLTSSMSIGNSVGTWTAGSTVTDTTAFVAVGPPTTEPPNPALYFLTASVTNSAVDLTSFTVAKPPLDAFNTYYARVKYKSNTIVTESGYSGWSGFETGPLT
jgi:hypothetical protein